MEPSGQIAKKVSPFFIVIIMIFIALALSFIYLGFQDFLVDNFENGSLNLTIGLIIIAISTYLLFQTQRRTLRPVLEIQPLNTTVLCQKCGFKNVREFQRGDYIFKQMEEPCPKCNEKTVSISSIFREVKEKAKRATID